jgi:xanthine phosphoribosyltransferase
MTTKRIITWDEFVWGCDIVAGQVRFKKWANMIAITRGGLIPAGILSHRLDPPIIKVVGIKTRDGMEPGPLRATYLPVRDLDEGDGSDTLVIDDVCDTGNTVEFMKTILPKATYVAVVVKPRGRDHVNFCAIMVPQDVWAVFPWEKPL